jgi:hypothetical protein
LVAVPKKVKQKKELLTEGVLTITLIFKKGAKNACVKSVLPKGGVPDKICYWAVFKKLVRRTNIARRPFPTESLVDERERSNS